MLIFPLDWQSPYYGELFIKDCGVSIGAPRNEGEEISFNVGEFDDFLLKIEECKKQYVLNNIDLITAKGYQEIDGIESGVLSILKGHENIIGVPQEIRDGISEYIRARVVEVKGAYSRRMREYMKSAFEDFIANMKKFSFKDKDRYWVEKYIPPKYFLNGWGEKEDKFSWLLKRMVDRHLDHRKITTHLSEGTRSIAQDLRKIRITFEGDIIDKVITNVTGLSGDYPSQLSPEVEGLISDLRGSIKFPGHAFEEMNTIGEIFSKNGDLPKGYGWILEKLTIHEGMDDKDEVSNGELTFPTSLSHENPKNLDFSPAVLFSSLASVGLMGGLARMFYLRRMGSIA